MLALTLGDWFYLRLGKPGAEPVRKPLPIPQVMERPVQATVTDPHVTQRDAKPVTRPRNKSKATRTCPVCKDKSRQISAARTQCDRCKQAAYRKRKAAQAK